MTVQQMTDEEFVRANWEWVQVRLAEPFEGIAKGKWTARLPLLPFSQCAFDTDAEAWAAAAEFTRERLKQIAEVREETYLLLGMVALLASERGDMTAPVYRRTIERRLEPALADLKRGMKP